jgi:hypothetical protein
VGILDEAGGRTRKGEPESIGANDTFVRVMSVAGSTEGSQESEVEPQRRRKLEEPKATEGFGPHGRPSR